MLEETVEALVSRVQAAIKDFETSALKVEGHAGKLFAKEVQDSATAWRFELASDIKAAGLKSYELVNKVTVAQSQPSMIRWASSGLIAGLILFGLGILVGIYVR
jgi:hypothetical protein